MENNERVSKIENFLLDPERTMFESLEEITNAIQGLQDALSSIDVAELQTLKGEDGYTPQVGVDFFTDEEVTAIEQFILDRLPQEGIDFPSPQQVRDFITQSVSAIPRIKGDKGERGAKGEKGEDGSPDTGEQIKSKLREAGGLELGDIKGLPRKIKELKELTDEFDELKEKFESIRITIPALSSDGGGSGGNIVGQNSISISGGVAMLVNDTATPGNSKYYGTNGSGVRGWYDLPTGGTVTLQNVLDAGNEATDSDIVLKNSTDTDTVEYSSKSVSFGKGTYKNQVVSGALTGNRTQTLQDKDGTLAHISDITKSQVGLGNVDNTSDLNKPISTATQSALNDKADDNAVVKLTGNQTVAGIKTFSSFPVTPSSAPTTNYQTANKKYVDDGLATKADDSAVVKLTGDQTVAGIKTFSSIPVLPASEPTTANQATRKSYVDDGLATKQATLVSGTNIKTLYGNSLLGSGDLIISPRTNNQTTTATLTPDKATYDNYYVTAQSGAITIANPTNMVKGDRIVIWIKDNGTARTISFGTDYKAFADNPLPTTTVVGKWMQIIIDKVDTNVVFVSHLVEA